jgi:hypothetical protein
VATGKPEIEALREKLIGDLTPFDDFAAAIRKHPKTLRKMRPPTRYVGRSVFVPTERGRKWILDGCPPVSPEAPTPRRRRA